jgi:hypothetical protein
VVVVAALLGLLSVTPADVPGASTVSGPSTSAAQRGGQIPEGAATARARYNEGDFAGALAAADAVDVEFRSGAAFTPDETAWMSWADARITRALALRRLGRDADADASLLDVAAVRPSYAPDKGFVPPRAVARFEELRDGLIGGATAAVTIVVEGGGGILLDGRPRGPGTVDVLPGPHFIGVSGGKTPRGEVIIVTGPRTVKLAGVAGAPVVASIDDHGAGAVNPGAAAEDGPPWLWIGVGGGALAVATAAVVVFAVVTTGDEPPGNPGGVTVAVDTSKLDPP